MARWFIGVAAMLAVSMQAHAADYSDKTPCSVAGPVVDSGDRARIAELRTYIENTMDGFDSIHTEKGEPGIMASLSDQGLTGMDAMVSVHCRQHPKMTIFNAASEVYRGMRDMEMTMGTAK